ncbi:MAG: DUF3488 and transglutaminase-like domain-containing protein [Acidimicrobiia bacterium]
MDLRHTLAARLALAALTCVAALSLRRVFDGASVAAPLVLAALLPFAAGLAARHRRRPAVVSATVSLLGLVVLVIVAFEGPSTWYGVPGGRTAAALSHHLAEGWHVLRTAVAPVPPRTGPVLLAILATWLVAVLAEWLAFRLDASVGALVPPLVLFVLSCALRTGRGWATATGAFVVTAVVFLLLQQARLLAHRRTWFSGHHAGSASRTLFAGVVLGTCAVSIGAVVGPRLPGAREAALVDYRHGTRAGAEGTGTISVDDPLVSVRAAFLRAPTTHVFTVRVSGGQRLYYRFAVLDRFDGSTWRFEADSERASSRLAGTPPPGTVRQDFHIVDLKGSWIPAAAEPRSISLPGARVIDDFDTLLAAGQGIDRTDYTVGSEVAPAPTPRQAAATAAPVPPRLAARYTALPSSFPAAVARRARAVTAGARNRYERADRLARYFTNPANGFVYDLDTILGQDNHAMETFLREKHGFCEQFAATFAAMARSVGVPARLAVGFTTGEPDPRDPTSFTVTNKHAHAWVEVWLSKQLGWVAFEPTPSGWAPGATPPSGGVGDAAPIVVATTTTVAPTPTGTAPPATVPATAPVAPTTTAGRVATPAHDGGTSPAPVLVAVGLPLLLLLAAAAAYVVSIPRLKRRRARARRRAPDSRVAVRRAWATAVEHLDHAGMPARASMTPREVADDVHERSAPTLGEPLLLLAGRFERAMYSGEPPTDAEATESWDCVDEIDAALHADETRAQRWRRTLDPRPLITRR